MTELFALMTEGVTFVITSIGTVATTILATPILLFPVILGVGFGIFKLVTGVINN